MDIFRKLLTLCTVIFLLVLPFSSAYDYGITYDDNGNILNTVENFYEYDEFNNLKRVLDYAGTVLEEYSYDNHGQRIKKVEGDTTTYYVNKNLIREVNSSGTFDTYYYYDDKNNLLMRKDSDGSKFYYHPDHLGSTTLITDEDGEIVEEISYLPFGEVSEGGNDRFLFTGKEKDASGLMYYGARYYDPMLRQFTQPDSVIPEMYNPQSLNRYSYVLNNPYKYTDPDGHNPLLLGSAIGGVIGGAVDMIKQVLQGRSMFDSSMDWGSVGTTAGIGAGAGLAGGAGYVGAGALGGGAIISTTAGGVTFGVSDQVMSNAVSGAPVTENVLEAGALGGTVAGVLGVGGKTISSIRTPKIDLYSGKVQNFPLSELRGHNLHKSKIMTPQKIAEGASKGPSEIYNYNGRLLVSDGMGRGGRYALLTGKNTIPGRIMNPDPHDVDVARYLWNRPGKKYNFQYLVDKMRRE